MVIYAGISCAQASAVRRNGVTEGSPLYSARTRSSVKSSQVCRFDRYSPHRLDSQSSRHFATNGLLLSKLFGGKAERILTSRFSSDFILCDHSGGHETKHCFRCIQYKQ